MLKLPPLSQHDKTVVMQTVQWVKTVNDAKPAGAPSTYPTQADIDSSALFRRIRQGLPPMPWAPPTRHGQPAYELIENARGLHRVAPDVEVIAGDSVVLDGAKWRLFDGAGAARVHHLSFGRWPIAYRLSAQDVPRWPWLPEDLDQGSGHDVVRFADGRLVSKELVRRTRDEVVTQWWLQCVSPLNERLYLHAERLPLEDPSLFRPLQVHRSTGDAPRVFACALHQGATLFFPLASDPWTRITRYIGQRAESVLDLVTCLSRFDAGESPLDFLPRTGAWQVFEIGADGEPWSAWRTDHREWLLPLEASEKRQATAA
ncbi:MAG TPA: hypothetical protein VK753_03595 [Xanthomonadaceae bacterium]|jgi:hypothetical protein|nr:hypothetical protein [Xanthomonadaceae bacterium]